MFVTISGPVNEMGTSITETFTESAPGIQSVQRFDGPHHPRQMHAFIHGHWESLALSATITYTAEEAIEIKSSR